MTGKRMRQSPLFIRNCTESTGKYGIPLIHKAPVVGPNIQLIACSETKAHDSVENLHKGVHFFVDDYRFQGIYNNPKKSLSRYAQYAFLLSPDFSMYADMPLWKQMESVAKNRWVGAFWQSQGLRVIPSISWSTARSFEFCFDGVETGSSVAVGMIGCKKNRIGFMRGYNAMLDKIQPSQVIVFGTPFSKMEGNIITVDYRAFKRRVC